VNEFSAVIIGAGTSGCTTAYLLAKWMEDAHIPGTVLLVDRGVEHSPQKGPDPLMNSWFDTWGSFGEAHPTVNKDGSPYALSVTDHKGIGGCGTHDTRITFQLRPEQQTRMAELLGWTLLELNVFFQAALNLVPVHPATSPALDPFYKKCIDALTTPHSNNTQLSRMPDDEYKCRVVVDSVAEASLAMYGDTEVRWTSALLLDDAVRPRNLKVLSSTYVDKVIINEKSIPTNDGEEEQLLAATGVVITTADGAKKVVRLSPGGSVAVTSGSFGTPAVLQRSGIGPPRILSAAGVPVLVPNEEVGHGVDHLEISVQYAWDEKNGALPNGGAMGWPLVVFANTVAGQDTAHLTEAELQRNNLSQAHFGAGHVEPSYSDTPSVVMTPACSQPDLKVWEEKEEEFVRARVCMCMWVCMCVCMTCTCIKACIC
jgi:choline dehydrogenase